MLLYSKSEFHMPKHLYIFLENEMFEENPLEIAIDMDTIGEEGNIFGEVICYFIMGMNRTNMI